jgi:hypothetical protein
MAVFLSLLGGVGAQFLDNNGDPLSGGKLYSYDAGTTTPRVTYTSVSGSIPHTNPIILDSAGRVPSGGEIWVTVDIAYKFVLTTSTDVLIATWDNISNSILSANADAIVYDPPFTGGVQTNVEDKLAQTISVIDFGAVGDGVANDTVAIQAALTYADSVGGATIHVPAGDYKLTSTLSMGANTALIADDGVRYVRHHNGSFLQNNMGITNTVTNYEGNGNIVIDGGIWDGNSVAFYDAFNHLAIGQGDNIKIVNCTFLDGIRAHAVDLAACRNVWIENNKFLGFSKYKHSPNGYGTSSDNLGQASSSVTFTDAGDLVTTSGVIPGNGESIQFSVISGTTGISIDTWYFVVNTSGSTFQVSTTFGGSPIALTGNGTGTMLTWLRNYSEAVQIDSNTPGSFGFGDLNGTPNINVFFKGNVVGPNPALTNNTFTSYGAGIGSHVSCGLNKFNQNVVVEGNTFIECGFAGVRPFTWVGVTIADNVFRGCLRCVHITPDTTNQQAGSDYTITGNVFESYNDIGVFIPAPSSFTGVPFYTKRVTITGNTFSNGITNAAAELEWVDGLTATGNVFNNVFRGFEMVYVINSVISNNTLKDAVREFLFWTDSAPSTGLAGASQNAIISNNQMTNLGYSAINVGYLSNFGITNNLIIGASTFEPTRFGITCNLSASNGLISGNTILDGGATNKPAYCIVASSTCSNISFGANKVFVGVTGDVLNESANANRVVQGMTTIDSNGQGSTGSVGLFLKSFDPVEGEIAVPDNEILSFGQYNESTGVFTETARVTSDRNLRVIEAGKGLDLRTPDGTKVYRITVDNAGAVTSTLV